MGANDTYVDVELGSAYEATKIFFGTMLNSLALAASRSFELQFEADVPFGKSGAIELLAAQAGANAPAIQMSVKAIADWNEDDTFAGAIEATWDEGANSSIPLVSPPSPIRTTIARTDLILPPARARTDGGTKAAYRIRGYCTAGTSIFAGEAGKNFDNWASRAAGRMRVRYNTTNGDQRASSSNWVASPTTPFVGAVVKSSLPVINVAAFGDSQMHGMATYYGAGPALLACDTLNTMYAGKFIFSYANRAFTGQTYAAISDNIRDYFAHGFRPDVVVLPIFSQNSVVSGFTQADADAAYQQLLANIALIRSYGAKIVLVAMPPAPYAQFQWGASGDAVRLAMNARVKADAGIVGIPFVDVPASFIGPVDGNGQQTPAGTVDGVHFGDANLVIWGADIATAIDDVWTAGNGNVRFPFEQGRPPRVGQNRSAGRSPYAARADHDHGAVWAPGASNVPASNGQVTMELTNNTTLTFRGRGLDGTTRSGTIALA